MIMSGQCLPSLRDVLQNLHEASQFLSQQKVTTVSVTSYLQTHLSYRGTVVDPALAEFKKVLVTDLQSQLSIWDNNVTDELLLVVYLDLRSRNSTILVIFRSVMEY